MSLRRLRSGELIALVAAAALAVLMFLPWYDSPEGSLTAWDEFGVVDVLAVIAVLAALVLVVATVTERSSALPVASAVWTTLLGMVAVLAIVIGLLDRPDHATSVALGGWLALLAAVLIVAGGWQSMRDERTELYETVTPPARAPRA